MSSIDSLERELKLLRHDYNGLIAHLRIMVNANERGLMTADVCVTEVRRLITSVAAKRAAASPNPVETSITE